MRTVISFGLAIHSRTYGPILLIEDTPFIEDVADKSIAHGKPATNFAWCSDQQIHRKRPWFQKLGQLYCAFRRLLSSIHNNQKINIALSPRVPCSVRTKEDDFLGMGLGANSTGCCLNRFQVNESRFIQFHLPISLT